MTQPWYVYREQKQQGPYTWEQLWDLARSGTLHPEDHVWTEGIGGWTPARRVPGLAAIPAWATVPPPPPPIGAEAQPPDLPPPPAAARQPAPARPFPWMLVGALAAALVLVAGGFGAAYVLLLRDRGVPAAPAPTAVLNPTATDAVAAPDPGGAEKGTADPIASTEESNAEPTAQATAESPTASPEADQGAPATPEPTVEPTLEPTADAAAAQPPAGAASGTPDPGGDQPGLPSPAAVVDEFVRVTLGTVPDAAVDYERARVLMTVAYAAEFDSPEFVPLTYGIQEGPTDYEIAAEELSDAAASVLVLGYWGADVGREWRFTLQEEAGLWRVADIEVVDAAEQDGGGGAQSPFWQLMPVVEAFTVYPNGGWELAVAFDPPAEDIGADFRIAYYREDDGSLVYDQESSGVIEAGRTRLTLDSDWTGYDLSAMGFRPGKHRVVAAIDGLELASGDLLVE